MENRKIFMCIALLFCLSMSAQAGMYKWYDEEGNVHYTQKPPPKNGERSTIDTSTFNSVETVKAKPIPKTPARPQRNNQTDTSTKKKRRSSCPYRK